MAIVAKAPGLAVTISAGWKRAAMFFARYEVAESLFRFGVPPQASSRTIPTTTATRERVLG